MPDDLLAHYSRRQRECQIQRIALERWLSLLNPIRWIMVASWTTLSLLASASILVTDGIFGEHSKGIAALCALGSAVLSGIHTAFHCDAHQADCNRMIGVFSGLEAAYQNLERLPIAQRQAREEDVEGRYERAVSTGSTLAPSSYRYRAAKELDNHPSFHG